MPITNLTTLTSHGNSDLRQDVLAIIDAGLAAADAYDKVHRMVRIVGDELVIGHAGYVPEGAPYEPELRLNLADVDRIYCFGAGKGIQRVGKALEDVLGERLTGGHLIDKKGGPIILERIEVTQGGHPTPDADGVRGCRRLLEMTQDLTERDLVFTAGGSGFSSLLTLPVDSVGLEDAARTVYACQIERGMTTGDLSPIRNHLDQLKGAKFAKAMRPATAVHLITKDPTTWRAYVYENTWFHSFPDNSTFADAVANLHKWDAWDAVPQSVREFLTAADPAYETVKPDEWLTFGHRIYGLQPDQQGFWPGPRAKAAELGYTPVLLCERVDAEARDAGRLVAGVAQTVVKRGMPWKPPVALICGGEMRVTVGDSKGVGGRNQEFALAVAELIAGSDRIAAAAVDTDGTDGPGMQYVDPTSDQPTLCGGVVDGQTLAEATARGVDVNRALRDHDATPALMVLDSGILAAQNTGLMDLSVVLVK